MSDGYSLRPLRDAVAEHVGGGTPARQVASYWRGSIPWASVKDFPEQAGLITDTEEHISEAGLAASASNLIPAGTPLVCTRMAVGRAAMPSESMAINQDVKALYPAAGVSGAYLLKLLQFIQRNAEAQAVGSTVKGIRIQDYLSIVAPIAEADAQPIIARVLDTIDTAIRETEAIIAKLKGVKQGLLHDLLTRGVDANGELRPSQSEAPHLYKQSSLGWIPKGWDCVRLANKLGVFGGKRLPAGHVYADHPTPFKYLRVTDFYGRNYALDDLENLHEGTFNALERYEIRDGHLYISIAGSLGYVGVHRGGGDDCTRTILTENAARLIPLCTLSPEFVSAYMNSDMVQRQVMFEKGTGGGVPKLALFRIEQFWLGWPNEDEQDRIAKRLLTAAERIQKEEQMFRKLTQQKAGLMDDLLTGRVRVKPLLTAKHQGDA